jgi:hypothetical protein
MEAIPIVVGTVYACMGIYNGVKTAASMYEDAKRLKKYYLDDARAKADAEPTDSFVLMNDGTQEPGETVVVTLSTFTLI